MDREDYLTLAEALYTGAIYKKLEGRELVVFCATFMAANRASFNEERFMKCVDKLQAERFGGR